MGTASVQGPLWGARARDWADVQEAQSAPLFEAVLQHTAVAAGTRLLDIGCGAGTLCGMAAQRGATVSGFDASTALLALARDRIGQGDFRAGDMEALPYPSTTFDVVTMINSFFFASDPVQALREARRVARTGAPVAIAVWGKPQDRDVAVVLGALQALVLAPPRSAAPAPALHEPGVLEAFVTQAGLIPVHSAEIACVWTYADADAVARGILAAGVAAPVIQHAGEAHARNAVLRAIAPFQAPSGQYYLRNTFRYLITHA